MDSTGFFFALKAGTPWIVTMVNLKRFIWDLDEKYKVSIVHVYDIGMKIWLQLKTERRIYNVG